MELDLNYLAKLLVDSGAEVRISWEGEDLARVLEGRCWQALREIRAVLDDETLDDPACFQRIEEIVGICERLGLGGGSRHDF